MIIIARKNIRYGGAELLIERISLGINQAGNQKSLILCNKLSTTMEERFRNAKVDVCILDNWLNYKELNKVVNDEDVIITTWIHDLLLLDMIRSRNKMNFKMIHYVITADDLCLGKSIPTSLGKIIFRSYYKRIIKRFHKDERIIYMDEESIYKPEKYYSIKLPGWQIVRLPYVVHDLPDSVIQNRANDKNSSFNILSVSRAEFPMKGYLLDLVSGFGCFYKEHPDSELYIITFGEGVAEINERQQQLPVELRQHVHIFGQMSYEELEKYWRLATVYVGLGTSVLDAADRGICSVAALQYSMHFKAKNLFCERPEQISCDVDVEVDGYEVIKRIYDMNSNEYSECCMLCHEKLKEFYELNVALETIIGYSRNARYTRKWLILEVLIEKFFLWFDDHRNIN